MRNTGSKPEIAGRYVGDGAAVFGEQIEIVLVDPHAMCRNEARPEHSYVCKIADCRTVIDLSSDHSLQPRFRNMHVDWKFMTIGDIHAVPQETFGAVMRNRGRDGDRYGIRYFRARGHDRFDGRNGPISACQIELADGVAQILR